MSCEAGSFGSPASTRCSQVTWFKSRFLSTRTTSWWLVHSRQYAATSMSAAFPSICIAPSPMHAITGRSGNANFAPSA